MGDYAFGLGPGHLPASCDKAARKHGAWLVNHTEPRGAKRHWFATANRGPPFDQATARAVLAEPAVIKALKRNGEKTDGRVRHRAYQDSNGWYVATARYDGFHQPSLGAYLTEHDARKQAAELNGEEEDSP